MEIPFNWNMDIAIPQYKNTEMLDRCLTSLSKVKLPENVNTIWVVENGGVYGAENVVSRFEELLPVKYLYLHQGNLSKARNLALEKTEADIILFFDNDITFDEGSVIAYYNAIQSHRSEGVGFFGGPLTPCYEEPPKDYLIPYLPWSVKGFQLSSEDEVITQPHFLGGNHGGVVRLLKDVGGYDEGAASGQNSGLVGEETRLMTKLLDMGFVGLYCQGANAHHYIPKENCSVRWTLKRTYRHGVTDASLSNQNHARTFLEVPYFIYKELALKLLGFVFPQRKPRFYYLNKAAYLIGNFVGFRKQ